MIKEISNSNSLSENVTEELVERLTVELEDRLELETVCDSKYCAGWYY